MLAIDEVNSKLLKSIGARFDVAIVGRADGLVSGTNVYFYDSLIETAAVHAGLVKRGEKAVVSVTIIACPPSGVGSTQNGVKSLPWDSARAGDTAFVLERRKSGAAPKFAPMEEREVAAPTPEASGLVKGLLS